VTSGPRRPPPIDLGRVCLVVTGAPGAGKSTVTRAVAEALSWSARLDSFDISNLVVSGHVWPLGEPADEAARQATLCHENLCALATNLMSSGFTPVVDVVVPDRKALDVFLSALGDRLRLVVLDPGTDVCVSRNAARAPLEQFFFDGDAGLHATMRTGFGDLGWWLDTSGMTAEETVEDLLAHAEVRARVEPIGWSVRPPDRPTGETLPRQRPEKPPRSPAPHHAVRHRPHPRREGAGAGRKSDR
jgi:predicted kinase